MVSIINAVERGAKKAQRKAPKGVFVTRSNSEANVIKGGVVVYLRNWVVNTHTGEASCGAYPTLNGQPASWPRWSTLRGGSIEEIIQATVMGVALGAYDV